MKITIDKISQLIQLVASWLNSVSDIVSAVVSALRELIKCLGEAQMPITIYVNQETVSV